MDIERLEVGLAELPLFQYGFFSTKELEFSERVRTICQQECPMYGKSWACPPGVGTVEKCRAKCLSYEHCLMIATLTEVEDIANLTDTLATRSEHEAITEEVRELMRSLGTEPYILSTEACTLCGSCAILEGKPCRMPKKMHPCVESQGINVIPTLEKFGIEFQYGSNVVTWVSLLMY